MRFSAGSIKRLPGLAADRPQLDPDRLFGRLTGARGLVLAVSGGPDSTALMILAARWSARPPCLVVCVDHGLRPGAAEEARVVAANAARLGLPSLIIRTPERNGRGNLQNWARRARYRCLTQAAFDAGFDAVVTAHHLDDQAETLLMRMARGSGVYGLAAMAEEGRVEGVRLARPLLQVPRQVLAGIAAESGLPLAKDPSNTDAVFDRVRVRALMPELAKEGLTAERLAGTAFRMRRAATALDHYAARLLSDNFRADSFGVVTGGADMVAQAPEEIGLRTLALIVRAVSGAEYPPPLNHTEALYRSILAASAEPGFRRTLHGVVVTLEAGRLSAHREWGREGLGSVPAPPGSVTVWDGRFRVEVPAMSGLTIGGLGCSRRKLRSNHAGAAAVRALPGLFSGESLLAVPQGVSAVDKGDDLDHLSVECLVGCRLAGA